MRTLLLALVAGVPLAGPGAVAADSLTPIRMQVRVAGVARLRQPLRVVVQVSADPGALDPRAGPIRARVKLSSAECGGAFGSTSGRVLLDAALRPQPDTGEAYSGSVSGSGRPLVYGVQNVCVYLTDDYEQFATDAGSRQVNVSRRCTLAAARYDQTVRRHGPRSRVTFRERRSARTACGPGVPL